MTHQVRKRKCKHCQVFFDPDHRNLGRQRYCSKPPCRKASKAASQRRWLGKPQNRDYFCGPAHSERVRQWRHHHPGYWRRKGSRAPDALQDSLTLTGIENQPLDDDFAPDALQDSFLMQPAVFIGLLAHLSGLSLQDDIALQARRLQQLGLDILGRSPHEPGGFKHAQTTSVFGQTPQATQAVQLGGSTPGP